MKITVTQFAEHLRVQSSDRFSVGAFADSHLVGIGRFHRAERIKRRHLSWIQSLFVSPEFRGCGIGKALLAFIIEEARPLPGLVCIFLAVGVEQQQARKVYASLGFRPYGIEPRALHVDGRYIDEELLALDLTTSNFASQST